MHRRVHNHCRPPGRVTALIGLVIALPVAAEEAALPLCPAPEATYFACPLQGGGGLQLCAPSDPAAPGTAVPLRVLAPDGGVQTTFGEALPPGDFYRANFLTTGALTLAHLRFEADGVEYVLVVGEDQTQGLAGLARATGPGAYAWRMCEGRWQSRLDYRFYTEARIPADPRAAPLP
jgi:hypothetical protein